MYIRTGMHMACLCLVAPVAEYVVHETSVGVDMCVSMYVYMYIRTGMHMVCLCLVAPVAEYVVHETSVMLMCVCVCMYIYI